MIHMKCHIALTKLSTSKMPELVGHVPICTFILKIIPQILVFLKKQGLKNFTIVQGANKTTIKADENNEMAEAGNKHI